MDALRTAMASPVASIQHALQVAITWWDALLEYEEGLGRAFASLALLGIAMALAQAQHLGLSGEMVYSMARSFMQLSLIGFVLNFIFKQVGVAGYLLIFCAFCFMSGVAGLTAGQRAKGVPKGRLIAIVAIFTSCAANLGLLILLGIFELTPRYLIPVSGMMVGNAMVATAVAMKRLREDLKLTLPAVEAALALGATPRQAVQTQVRRALGLALTPVLDTTKTVGLISLPGAMTGLIMGGASPFEAARLQMVVMNFLIGCSTMSSMIAVFLAWPQFFTPAYQVVRELLE